MRADFDETDLREALSDLVGDAELSPNAARDARRRSRRRRRRQRIAAIATSACAVALIGVLVPLLRPHATRTTAPATAPASPPTPAACAKTAVYPSALAPAGPTGELVPPNPVAARVCRYAGFGEDTPSTHLVAGKAIGAGDATRLAARLDAGTRLDPSLPYPSCPNNGGAADTVTFGYKSRPPVAVTVSLEGCRLATNGSVQSFTTPDAQRELKSLVGAPNPHG